LNAQQLKLARDTFIRYYRIRRINPADAEDFAQEALLKRLSVRAEIKAEVAYLRSIANGVMCDALRLRQNDCNRLDNYRDHLDAVRPMVPDVLDQVIAERELLHVFLVIRQMPKCMQRVFTLRKVYGYSQKEIAARLKITESTVENHLKRGVTRFSQVVGVESGVIVTTPHGRQE
jgi:RNA polymerase sigma factor (sigma-70 family)